MRYNGLAPNRAHDVLYFLRLVEGTGEPSIGLVSRVADTVARMEKGEGLGPERTFPRVTYDEVARRIGWHRGGPGDHLAKALTLVVG
jgi:hypothetical protein